MTNGLALAIVLIIAAFLLLDATVLHIGAALFLARRGIDLIQYLAFWR